MMHSLSRETDPKPRRTAVRKLLGITTLLVALLVIGGLFLTAESESPRRSGDAHPELAVMQKLIERYEGMTYAELHKARYDEREFVEELSFDPTTSKYFEQIRDKLKLTDEELEIYRRQGFVSVDHVQRHSFGSAYYQIYSADLPVFVSSDSILNALHQSFDSLLKELEISVLSPSLADILKDGHETLAATSVPYSLKQNQLDVDLYLTVARNLLADQRFHRPSETTIPIRIPSLFGQDDQVTELLTLIAAEEIQVPKKDRPTSIYGGDRYVDYSQFRPRGHYTHSPTLSAYFRCMMWLSRADCGWFVLPTDPSDDIDNDPDRELRNAALLALMLDKSGRRENFESMSRLLTAFVGGSDNLTMTSLGDMLKKHGIVSADELSERDRLNALSREIEQSGAAIQMIRSQAILSPDEVPYTMPPPALVQMFGQSFVIDSLVLSNVVFDSIFYNDEKVRRMMPTGLDVMAALGNDEALLLLEPELEQWHYSGNLRAASEFVELCLPEFWESRLYNVWIDALRELDDEIDSEKHVPETMRTRVWQKKQLQTQLASWSELRHDTVLIAKQSFTGVPGCEYPAGYVEPYPTFYRKLAQFAGSAREDLVSLFRDQQKLETGRYPRSLHEKHLEFFRGMVDVLRKLETIALKELDAKALTPEEEAFLEQTIDRRGSVKFGSGSRPRYDGWFCDLIYNRADVLEWSPTITDVHTYPNRFGESEALQVGVGDVNFVVIAVNCKEKSTAYVGPVYSYYEFSHPANDRLTDETWQSKIASGQVPKRPEWAHEFQGTPEQRNVDGLAVSLQDNKIQLIFTTGNRTTATREFPNSDSGVAELVSEITRQKRSDRVSLDLSKTKISETALVSLESLPNLIFLALPSNLATHEATVKFRENHPHIQIRPEILTVTAAKLCQSVSGYDVYEQLPEAQLKPGNEFYIYLELTGVHASSDMRGYTTSLQMSCELTDSLGQTVDRHEYQTQQRNSNEIPRHNYLSQPVKLPENLASGEYQLKIRVTNDATDSRIRQMLTMVKPPANQSLLDKQLFYDVETTIGLTVSVP